MIAKHTVYYFLGRGVPGIINFLALSIYTRLLNPQEYGKYSILIATITLFTTVLYQWIRLTLLRFLPRCLSNDDREKLMSSVIVGFSASCIISLSLVLIYYFFFSSEFGAKLIFTSLLLLWLQAVLEIFLEFLRSNLEAKKYSIINFLKSFLAIVIGSVLAYCGWGAVGLISGLSIATLLVLIVFYRDVWRMLPSSLAFFDKNVFLEHLRYGLPLTISFAMAYVFNVSDRYFINHYIGKAATGIYSVGFDLAKQTLWVIMMSINLANYPLVVREIENDNAEAAQNQLKMGLKLLLGISMPAAVGLAVLSGHVANLLLGKEFVADVTLIVPYVAIGALIAGTKSYYIDLSFQLGKKTHLQIYSVTVAALVSLGLNFIFIPLYGLMGAVYSALISYVIDLIVSFFISRRSFLLPFPCLDVAKIATATAVMGITIFLTRDFLIGLFGIIVLILIGLVVYTLMLFVLGVLRWPLNLINQKNGTRKD